MRRRLRLIRRAVLSIALMGTAVSASPPPPGERAEAFAVCAGRLWALSVRQRAVGNPEHEVTGLMRADFDMLLDAVLPDAENDARATHWRVDGWVQIAHLLARHQYAETSRRRNLAAARMEQRIATCRRMIPRR